MAARPLRDEWLLPTLESILTPEAFAQLHPVGTHHHPQHLGRIEAHPRGRTAEVLHALLGVARLDPVQELLGTFATQDGGANWSASHSGIHALSASRLIS